MNRLESWLYFYEILIVITKNIAFWVASRVYNPEKKGMTIDRHKRKSILLATVPEYYVTFLMVKLLKPFYLNLYNRRIFT